MSKRFTDTDLWDKEWFMGLSCKLKCLVKFVRDKCNNAGIWKPNWTLAGVYIGEKVSQDDLLGIDLGKQFKLLSTGEIYCMGFIEFQYGILSKECRPHIKILSFLEKYTDSEDRLCIGYPKGINTLQEEEEDKEEEEEGTKGGAGGKSVVFKPSDLKQYFSESPAYRDKLCIAHKLTPEVLAERFEEFFKDQEAKETIYQNRRDATTHFGNWLKLKKTLTPKKSALKQYIEGHE